MVMKYAYQGSLRNTLYKKKNYLHNKCKHKSNLYFSLQMWKYKIKILREISVGLRRIHSKELIHRDLHIGNIVVMLNRLS
jgi:serine/threonine protein kinase